MIAFFAARAALAGVVLPLIEILLAWAEHGRPEDLPAMRALFGKRGA